MGSRMEKQEVRRQLCSWQSAAKAELEYQHTSPQNAVLLVQCVCFMFGFEGCFTSIKETFTELYTPYDKCSTAAKWLI